MYDYSYLAAKVLYSEPDLTSLQGTCMICERRFYATGSTREKALYNLRFKYRNHRAPDRSFCVAGKKSYVTTRARNEERKQQYHERKAKEGKTTRRYPACS